MLRNLKLLKKLKLKKLEILLEGHIRPSRTKSKERCSFIIGDWNAKIASQELPGVTGRFGLGVKHEAGQRLTRVLPREHTGHSKHPVPTTQENTLHMDITRWSTPKSD